MDTTLITGIVTIVVALGVSCYMVRRSKNIIEGIRSKNLKELREIKRELKL